MYKRDPDCAYYRQSEMYGRSFVGMLIWFFLLRGVEVMVKWMASGNRLPQEASDIMAVVVILQLILSLCFLDRSAWTSYRYVDRNKMLYELDSEPIGGRDLALDDIVLERRHSFLSWLWPRWGTVYMRGINDTWRATKWQAKQQGSSLWYRDWYSIREGGYHLTAHGFEQLLTIVTHETAEEFFNWAVPRSTVEFIHNEVQYCRVPGSDWTALSSLRHLLDQTLYVIRHWKNSSFLKSQKMAGLEEERDFLGALLLTVSTWSLVRCVDGKRSTAQDSPYLQANGWFTQLSLLKFYEERGCDQARLQEMLARSMVLVSKRGLFDKLLACKEQIESRVIVGKPIYLEYSLIATLGVRRDITTSKAQHVEAPTNTEDSGQTLDNPVSKK